MKMLSTILYREDAVIAIMAGIAYCKSNFPIGCVPNSVGIPVFAILYFLSFYLFNLNSAAKVHKNECEGKVCLSLHLKNKRNRINE